MKVWVRFVPGATMSRYEGFKFDQGAGSFSEAISAPAATYSRLETPDAEEGKGEEKEEETMRRAVRVVNPAAVRTVVVYPPKAAPTEFLMVPRVSCVLADLRTYSILTHWKNEKNT